MCIKTIKTTQKCENRKGHFHGSLESENGGWRKVGDEVCGWCMEKKPYSCGHLKSATHIYKIATLILKITKMPLLVL